MTEAHILDQIETSNLDISSHCYLHLIEDLSDMTEALTQTILDQIETSNLDISSQLLLFHLIEDL